MNELPCAVCGARPVDEFRQLGHTGTSAEPVDAAEERWWHALGCRRVSRLERGADGRLLPWADEPVSAAGLPEVVWLAPPSDEAEPDVAEAVPAPPPAPLPHRRRDSGPAPLTAPSTAAHGAASPDAAEPAEPAEAPQPAVPAGDGGPGDGSDVLVALPDEPPVPFERPEWPAGPEADVVEPEPAAPRSTSYAAAAPTPPLAPLGGPPDAFDEDDGANDRFRDRRAAAQSVERAVRRPVGLIGPGQPRAVDVTRRPAVDAQRPRRAAGVEPRPPAPASSLFARGRSWRDADDAVAGLDEPPVDEHGDGPGATVPGAGAAGPTPPAGADPARGAADGSSVDGASPDTPAGDAGAPTPAPAEEVTSR